MKASFVRLLLVGTCLISGACASSGTADPEMIPDEPVRVAPSPMAVKFGDCREALRRAAEKPDLDVDRLPTPRTMVPAPIPAQSMPAAVRGAKYNAVRVTVLVDTLGRREAPFGHRVAHAGGQPRIRRPEHGEGPHVGPAELAGCKVPRLYKWGASAGTPPKGVRA
jgi:hypothetical protein